ncbi:MAG: hypothetical protein ACLFSQ_04630 [Candidatus Zixiibacteriota bacterium]
MLSTPSVLSCGDNAFPFAFADDYYTQPVAAISYPFIEEDNCSTFIVVITGTHSWETYASIVASNFVLPAIYCYVLLESAVMI